MQQAKQVLRYDRPSWDVSEEGRHLAVVEGQAGYTLHGCRTPAALDRVSGADEEYAAVRVSPERVERWCGALAAAVGDDGGTGIPDAPRYVAVGEETALYDGGLPAAAETVVEDMERLLAADDAERP